MILGLWEYSCSAPMWGEVTCSRSQRTSGAGLGQSSGFLMPRGCFPKASSITDGTEGKDLLPPCKPSPWAQTDVPKRC